MNPAKPAAAAPTACPVGFAAFLVGVAEPVEMTGNPFLVAMLASAV